MSALLDRIKADAEKKKEAGAGAPVSAPASSGTLLDKIKADAAAKKQQSMPHEERRAQLVEVTDTSVPDAKPVVMTLGEYEDLVAKEKAEYEAKVSAGVAENSRLSAMSVHEKQQHGGELADKRMQEFSSRYKMFTPKEERMHGAEAPTVEELQPAIYNAAKAKAAAGDYAGAQELLREGYASGLYGQDAFIGAYGDIVSDRSVTPETRLAGLKKAADREAEKKQRAQAAFADAGTTRDQQLASGAKELLDSVNPQYQKMYDHLHERIDAAPHEQKKAEKEGERDAAYSAAIWQLDEELARLKAEAAHLVEAEKAAWKNAGDLYTSIDYTSADASARQEEYIKAHDAALAAKRAVTDNEAQIFYINGLKSFAELPENDRLQFVQCIRGGDYKETYKRIKVSMGKDDFERMVETVAALENAVKAAERDIGTAKFAAMHPVMGSLASVFTSLIGGVSAAAGVIAHGIDNLGEGEGYKAPIDTNGLAFAPTKHANVIRGTVAGNIEREVGGTGGKVASFLYQTGMSGVDSLAASFTGNWGGALLLGTSSASNAFLDAKERGASDSQAIWTGLFAGVFETLFERVSIGNLNALKETPVGTVKDILKNVGKSALVNATEEGLTEAATAISDYLINGDFSQYGAMYKELIAEGVSPEAAKAQVKAAFWQQNLVAAAGGALMGIGFAGGTGTLNYATGRSANTDLGTMYKNADGTYNTEAVQALIAEGIASENGEIARYAASIRTAIEQGKSVDAKQLGALQRALAAEQSADAPAVTPMDTEVQTAPATTGAPVNVMSDTALAGMMGVSRGNVLVPNGDGTNRLVPVEQAPARAPVTMSENDKKVLGAIERTKTGIGATDLQARVAGMLAGSVSNATADRIANTPELAKAFTELGGVELTGTVAEKRRAIKANAALVAEKYRIGQREKTSRAIERAGYQNSAEPMIGEGGALGAYGKAAYKALQQRGTDAYVRGGLGAAAVKHYNAEFGAYYKQGFSGVGFSYNDTRMSEADARTAFEAGERDARIADAATASEKSGILHGASDKEIDTAKRLSKVFGRDVLFVNAMGVDGFNGCYIEDGNIYLQVGAKDPILQIVSHEFVHSLESKKLYTDLRDFVFAELMRGGKTEEDLRAEKKAQRGYGHLEGENLDREIVAQWVAEKLLTDEKTIRRIVQAKGKTFAQKLHDLWNALIAKAKSAFGVKTDADVQSQLDVIERGRALLAEVIKSEEGARDSGVRYDTEKAGRITEWSIRSALYDALEKGDFRQNNLILLGFMPEYIQSKLGIDGELYVFRNHIYENMVSEEQANAEGRNRGKGEHFHALGEDTLVNAILALEHPSIVIEDRMTKGNPEISMVLPVYGPNDLPIHAAIAFYRDVDINGKFDKKPHIAVTFYEHPYDDYKNDRGLIRDGLLTTLAKAREENRILDISEEIRVDLPVIAENPVLGNIAKSTLNKSIDEFKKKVNDFKEKNKINYSFAEDDAPKKPNGEERELADGGIETVEGTVVKSSYSSWTPAEKARVEKALAKAGFEEKVARKWIADVDSVAAVILRDRDRLDYEADPDASYLKPNSEYKYTLDASTLCPKRLFYQGTMNAIQKKLGEAVLLSEDLIRLGQMLKENGYESPCAVCYVESRRRNLGKFAEKWVSEYTGAYKPTMYEMTTTEGNERLKREHPQAYADFIKGMKKIGVNNPKVVEKRTDYRGDLKSKSWRTVKKINAMGGLRVSSFSDFETVHLIDMMQAILDMSAKGFTSQAYTKIPNFAWVFGDTGIKINLSLIAEGDGFDADGNLAFSAVEGMDINDALALREAYSENVGTIIVGANEKHILACMADDRIDFIIPFHKSGWGAKELEALGLSGYKDFSEFQLERYVENGKKVFKKDVIYPLDYWDFSKSGKENAETYLAICAERGLIPKFDNFLVNNGDGTYSLQPDGTTDGYWKTLIDFKMYDNNGKGSPQVPVQPNFNMDEAMRVLNEYEGGANALPVAKDVVDAFVKEYNEKDAKAAPRVQYSFSSDEAEEHHDAAVAHFGRTSKWEATGYLLTDGTRLDLSGGHGRRTYGHHVIGKAIGIDGGVRGQIRFMQEGNVRVSPELPGIELNATTEPTEEQYGMLARFVDKVADGESFAVDFTDKDGKYLDTIEYEGGLYADDVLADIRQFYRNGAIRKPSELSRFRYSFREDAPKMPNGEDVPTSNDVRISPLASAEKMLRGGMPWSEVQKRTKLTMRQIALQMKANGASVEDVRSLTGLYQDELGAWRFDEEWMQKNVPDLATNHAEKYAAAQSAFEPTAAGIDPGELDRAIRRVKNLEEGTRKVIRPSGEEFAQEYAERAVKTAIELVMKQKVPTVDAVLRTGTTLLDMAKAMKGKYAEGTILKKTGYALVDGEWLQNDIAISNLINAASKDLTLDDYMEFEKANAKEIADSEYKQAYGRRKPYALGKLGVKIASPIVDIEASGDKPMQLRQNESEQYRLRRYINESYGKIVRPTEAERTDAHNVVNGQRTMAQLGEGSRRDVVLELVYLEQALRGMKDDGVEMQYFLNKQRFKERVLQTIFGDENAELPTKSKFPFQLGFNTASRNSIDVFGEEVGERVNEVFFDPIRTNEVNRIRFLNEQTAKIAALELNEHESAAVQMKAENTKAAMEAYAELIKEHGGEIDIVKVDRAVPVFHELYNLYYDAVNDFLVMHGYKPIGFIKNYMPHVQKDEVIGALREQLNALGFDAEKISELPTEIAGRTEQFKPGKKWTPYFLQRRSERGDNVNYDAVGCFDSYVSYISEVLYHTDDIQKLRVLNQALRERYASDEVSGRIGELRDKLYSGDPDRDIHALEEELAKAYGELKKNKLYGTYVTWLDNYTNTLAGKQTAFDRIFENNLFGRKFLYASQKITNQFAAATIAGNLSSAVNQLVQLPLVAAESGGVLNRHMAHAFWDIAVAHDLNKTVDFDAQSGFLVGKKGIQYAADSRKAKTVADHFGKFTDLMSWPFTAVDNFAMRLMLRTKFYQLVAENKDMSAEEAIEQANLYVEKVVGSRLKGMRPTAFISKNLCARVITMFQLEQLNVLKYVSKDVPREFRNYAKAHGNRKAWAKLLGLLASALLNTFLFNRISQEMWGQTPAPFDLLGIFTDAMGAGWNVTGNGLLKAMTDAISEKMFGVRFFGTEELGEFDAAKARKKAGKEIMDDIPIVGNVAAMLGITDSRLPLPKIYDRDIKEGLSGLGGDDKVGALKQLGTGVGDVAKTWLPLGSQVSKAAKGAGVAVNHGMRTARGNVIFAKDMLSDDNLAAGIWDTVRVAMFGPGALEEYNRYWIDGKYLSKKDTGVYDELTEAGLGYEAAYRAVKGVRGAGTDAKENGDGQKAAMLEMIDTALYGGEYKEILYHNYVASQSDKDAIYKVEALGADKGEIYNVFRDMYRAVEDEDKLDVLQNSKFTEAQKAAVYYEKFASEREREIYDEFTEDGADPGKVYALMNADGAADKATSIRESGLPYEQKEKAFYKFISDAWEEEVEAVKSVGGNIDNFAAAYSAARGIVGDKDENGKTVYLSKSKKLKAAIDKAVPKASKRVKEALYEAFGVSEKVW